MGRGLSGASIAWVLVTASQALAQPAPAQPARPAGAPPAALPPAQPARPAGAPPAALPPAASPPASAAPAPAAAPPAATAQPGTAATTATTTTATAAASTKADPIATALAAQPGGLTLDDVAKLALKTKPSLRAKEAELKQAAAKVDQAFVGYFPRVSLTGSYVRLSEVTTSLGNGSLLGVQGPSGLVNVGTAPCPTDPAKQCTSIQDANGKASPLFATALNIPVALDTFNFTASLLVPVSDYLLRITQGHAAASHGEKSKQIELEAVTLQEAADAKVAYLNWVRAKGQVVVAKEAVAQANAHLEDTKRLKLVGLASQADVLRVESQVATAEQGLVQLEAFETIAQEQVRIGLGLPKDKPLTLGIDVMNISAPASIPQLTAAQDQAMDKRLEIRSLDETELSLKEAEKVTRAGLYPRLDAVADLTVANPNQRYPFAGPVTNTTWDAGVRISWTINDTLTTVGAAAEAKARVSQIAAQKQSVRDGLKLEVTSAWAEIKKSGASIDAATRGLAAAEESLRVRRELFQQGKATNVEMLDAETELTRARLTKLDAQIGLIVAQIKYDHATGADVGSQKPASSDAAATGDDASVKKTTNVASATQPLLPLAK
jgi:outer membrane protein TolC